MPDGRQNVANQEYGRKGRTLLSRRAGRLLEALVWYVRCVPRAVSAPGGTQSAVNKYTV